MEALDRSLGAASLPAAAGRDSFNLRRYSSTSPTMVSGCAGIPSRASCGHWRLHSISKTRRDGRDRVTPQWLRCTLQRCAFTPPSTSIRLGQVLLPLARTSVSYVRATHEKSRKHAESDSGSACKRAVCISKTSPPYPYTPTPARTTSLRSTHMAVCCLVVMSRTVSVSASRGTVGR